MVREGEQVEYWKKIVIYQVKRLNLGEFQIFQIK